MLGAERRCSETPAPPGQSPGCRQDLYAVATPPATDGTALACSCKGTAAPPDTTSIVPDFLVTVERGLRCYLTVALPLRLTALRTTGAASLTITVFAIIIVVFSIRTIVINDLLRYDRVPGGALVLL